MARISDAIGYDVEVSEPNGPTVHGYITDRWANSRQPLPVKPRREDMVEAMLGSDIITDDLRAEANAQGSTQREPFLCFADAILDLWPGRSEAEVKAEALREARDAVRASSFWADGSDNYADRVRGYLSARADRLSAEGGADRG